MFSIISPTDIGLRGCCFFRFGQCFFISSRSNLYLLSHARNTRCRVFLASVYYLLLFYRSENGIVDKWILVKLSLSAFALFSTKYPYGYLLLLTILIVHTSLYLEEVVLFATRYIAYITQEIKSSIGYLELSFWC